MQNLCWSRIPFFGSVLCKKEKVEGQESLLDFGTHPLGSVLCIRKQCSVRKEDSKGSSVK